MQRLKIAHLRMKRRKLLPFVDISPFFMFFGISGMPGARQYRVDRRFEQEFYSVMVTAQLSGPLVPGLYRLDGLPDEVNKRGWTVRRHQRATTDMSEEGWHDLQRWWQGGRKDVQAVWIADLPLF